MATSLRRFFSVSTHGVFLKKRPGSSSHHVSQMVKHVLCVEMVTFVCILCNGLLETSSGGNVDNGFLRWRNGGGMYHSSAAIDSSALVEFGAVVHEKAILGPEVRIGSNTVVGPSVEIGSSTKIGNCSIGDLCVIHNGVCIGQDGFGFYVDEHGNMVKKPQTLNVKIGNRVEIGANTCIDRGSWRDTVIGDDTKIDNLVQIGHNVIIGKCCLFCGQVGIAGSAEIGDYVTLGGRVAVRDHVSIVSKVRLAANSCVTKNITEPGDFGGFPAEPITYSVRQSQKT
ncbi:bacterial transferase hexapeptide repeat-containing protein [Arabidopsis lyrata subsp. lyrata]|uniref:Bacterial transferase hexapeptide repeat-containing protein n=1 Tax=Arabidopsis lyrata subsp. lyrata TaxID=81972 RepID=D7M1Z3_ARALL|nr:bacterial transferase hexapeptide repeat-containing protein [Arabidopsis lyrata subsp. lyrata]